MKMPPNNILVVNTWRWMVVVVGVSTWLVVLYSPSWLTTVQLPVHQLSSLSICQSVVMIPTAYGLSVEPVIATQTNRRRRHTHRSRRRHHPLLQQHTSSPENCDGAVLIHQKQPVCFEVVADTSRTREDVRHIMDTMLVPTNERSYRMNLRQSSECQDNSDTTTFSSTTTTTTTRTASDGLLLYQGNDPTLYETYGEFPLSSLDQLLDRAQELIMTTTTTTTTTNAIGSSPALHQQQSRRLVAVDLGSGCGRLALYMALSRQYGWDIHGIEIAPVLHQYAMNTVIQRAMDLGYIVQQQQPVQESQPQQPQQMNCDDDENNDQPTTTSSRLTLHCGPASDYTELLLQRADIIFCYSTAFASSRFAPEISALILSTEWNELLSSRNNNNNNKRQVQWPQDASNVICITTDKALDPDYGWKILDRIDVHNPEVLGSTGYIQRLKEATT